MSWLSEQVELVHVIRLMFSWLPVQLQDFCTAIVCIVFLVALMRLVVNLKEIFFNWL